MRMKIQANRSVLRSLVIALVVIVGIVQAQNATAPPSIPLTTQSSTQNATSTVLNSTTLPPPVVITTLAPVNSTSVKPSSTTASSNGVNITSTVAPSTQPTTIRPPVAVTTAQTVSTVVPVAQTNITTTDKPAITITVQTPTSTPKESVHNGSSTVFPTEIIISEKIDNDTSLPSNVSALSFLMTWDFMPENVCIWFTFFTFKTHRYFVF